jgi:cobalt/nickel transport system permease protein
MLLHIGAFRIDIDSEQSTLWHRLAPRTRILCTLLFVFATALTPNGRWWTWAVYSLGLAVVVLVSQVTLPVLLRRVAIEFTFIATVLLGTLFRSGGEVLWKWGWMQITTEGVTVLGSVTLKALMSLLMLNLLVLTTSIPALLKALVELKTPPLLVAIFASMYRYVYVLIEEFSSMRRAATARNLTSGSPRQRQVIGNMIGSLFIRTYERGDRIHKAMLARGYTGLPPVMETPKGGRLDIAALTLTATLTLAGQFIYLGIGQG